MESGLETFKIPNPLVLAAIQLQQQILLIEDSVPPTQVGWQRCVLASSLGARFGLNTDGVKAELDSFVAERDIPEGKPGDQLYKLLKEFHKTTKEPPMWFSQWKAKKQRK